MGDYATLASTLAHRPPNGLRKETNKMELLTRAQELDRAVIKRIESMRDIAGVSDGRAEIDERANDYHETMNSLLEILSDFDDSTRALASVLSKRSEI